MVARRALTWCAEVLEEIYLNIIAGRSRNPLAAAVRGGLALAELPYRRLMRMRNRRYDQQLERSHDLGRPTISVGNITAGGTGKTPVVQWLADALCHAGRRPAVLMRGYRKSGSCSSDEQVMLQNLLPGVMVEADADRVAGAKTVLSRDGQTDCFILDDGFQHRRAKRHCDLVLINAVEPFGFGHVHPRGLLREPLSGLARAHAVLITHASEVSAEALLQRQNAIAAHTSAPVFHCDHVNDVLVASSGVQRRPVEFLRAMPFALFTGIGQPQSVIARLGAFGQAYKGARLFDDHHHYTSGDMELLRKFGREVGAQILVTTDKDWAKLAAMWPTDAAMPPLYRLGLRIAFWDGEEPTLFGLINRAIRM